MIRILVADDHTVVREGLKQLLKSEADFEVVGEAQNGDDVARHLRSTAFDVLLLDTSMPGTSGIELIKQVHAAKPAVRTLVLSMHEDHQYAVRAIRAGAAGYLAKGGASSLLADAIRKVANGGAYVSPAVAEQLALGAMPDAKGPPHAALSDREFQVFRMIAEGMSVSDIADALGLSVKTVSTHKANILQKMGMSTQAELIRYALTHRLVEE
jgi:DNA-binding NarL/FixJ family response regulator